MAKNKGAIVRYRALDRCLRDRKRKYGINELLDAVSRALTDAYSTPMRVARSQLYNDLNYMESDAGYAANIEHIQDGRRVFFRYEDPDFSIEKMPLTDEEIDQLRETVLMLNRFKGMPHFTWMEEIVNKLEDTFLLKGNTESVIGFDQNIDFIGLKYITPLFDAIINKRVLSIRYKSFKAEKSVEYEMHPYYLKQYNNRWFLLGRTSQYNQITNLALDRIESISVLFLPYIEKPQDLDFETYFDDVVGVTIPMGQNSEHIVMRFTGDRYPYVKNKPIHWTQHNYDKTMQVSIDVIPNNELITQLLSYGSQMEVLEPQSVRDKMREHVRTMHKFYK